MLARQASHNAIGARGAMLRAYDKATGKEVGAVLYAGATERLADDVHVQRQTVHRRGRQGNLPR